MGVRYSLGVGWDPQMGVLAEARTTGVGCMGRFFAASVMPSLVSSDPATANI